MAQGDYCSYLDRFPNVSLLCMGDLMLDIFVYGKSTRLSPEAPVPVMLCQKERSMPGGAGNMIANLRSLDCAVHFIGAVGTIPVRIPCMKTWRRWGWTIRRCCGSRVTPPR